MQETNWPVCLTFEGIFFVGYFLPSWKEQIIAIWNKLAIFRITMIHLVSKLCLDPLIHLNYQCILKPLGQHLSVGTWPSVLASCCAWRLTPVKPESTVWMEANFLPLNKFFIIRQSKSLRCWHFSNTFHNFDIFSILSQIRTSPLPNFGVNPKFDHIPHVYITKVGLCKVWYFWLIYFKSYWRKTLGRGVGLTPRPLSKGRVKTLSIGSHLWWIIDDVDSKKWNVCPSRTCKEGPEWQWLETSTPRWPEKLVLDFFVPLLVRGRHLLHILKLWLLILQKWHILHNTILQLQIPNNMCSSWLNEWLDHHIWRLDTKLKWNS